MLLILTTKHDLTADYMIIKLRELDVPHFRLNSDELDRFGFLVQINEQHEAFKVRLGGRVVDFSDVTCVWYRRAITIASPPGVIPEYQQFAKGELRHLLEGILPRPWIRWVNPISATELGERKVHQLTVARSAGLKLPDSIIATELDELKGFIERHQGRVICKPIYQGFVAGTSNNSAVYTHRVAVSELNDAEQLRACPTLLQEEVRRGRDVRVTFVGDDVYAVAITSSTPGFVDWRAEASGLQYEQIELTSEVETACRELLGRLGLVYGAFDFILADDGTWYFLEVNPVGEWAWLEETLGMPIRESFIRLFVSPSTRRREWPTK